MKKVLMVLLSVLLIFQIGCSNEKEVANSSSAKIEFEDDLGNTIQMNEPAKKIISLYSAHTENLFALGLDEEIIGVGKSDAYPQKVRTKKIYDYKSDPEKVIAAGPDAVLIRPFIQKSYPEFIEALQQANIQVVCLYPETFDKFPEYIEKLGKLTGKEEKAKELLNQFTKDLKEIEEKTKDIKDKPNVFFEATETEYRTVTKDSMAAKAISLAGGNNIAKDAKAMREGTSIASYGEEKILEKAKDIDVYISQRGAMNAGGNEHSISIRKGFDAIKAVKEKRVYEMNEKLVSSPTFRFSKGVKELARIFYPDMMDNMDAFDQDVPLDRDTLASMVMMSTHKGIFAPTSKYYEKNHKGHVYGTFKDVSIDHPNFDYIETAVLSGYIESESEKFDPDQKVTKEEFSKSLFMMMDLKEKEKHVVIKDIGEVENGRMIQMIIDYNLMDLEDGYFHKDQIMTQKEALKSMKKIKELMAL